MSAESGAQDSDVAAVRERVVELLRAVTTDAASHAERPDPLHSAPLAEWGLDSFGIFDFVLELEREFGMTVADEDLVPRNFHTVEDAVAFVVAKAGPDRRASTSSA